jgi:hypothetical protein
MSAVEEEIRIIATQRYRQKYDLGLDVGRPTVDVIERKVKITSHNAWKALCEASFPLKEKT